MPRIEKATRRIEAVPANLHKGFFDARLRPVAVVDSGATLCLCTISLPSRKEAPIDRLSAPERDVMLGVADDGYGPHYLTGPIAVRDTRPGDVLQVDILRIRLKSSLGYNLALPERGLFRRRLVRRECRWIAVDRRNMSASLFKKVTVKLRPFLGIVAVAPPASSGRISSIPPGNHGGNIDNRELIERTSILLPVFATGALLSVGDAHGAQGDGEVNGTAIEISAEATIRVQRRRDLKLRTPIAFSESKVITMGFGQNLDDAAAAAMEQMIGILTDYGKLTESEAYCLASAAVNLRITQVVNQTKGAHAVLNRSSLGEPSALWSKLSRRFRGRKPRT